MLRKVVFLPAIRSLRFMFVMMRVLSPIFVEECEQ